MSVRHSDPSQDATVLDAEHRFLSALHADRQRGVERTVEDYAARFPECSALVHELLEAPSELLESSTMPSAEPLPCVGGFQLLRKLGRGGQGVVYVAHDERLDRQVALKVLPPEHALDPIQRLRLRREARLLSSVRHPSLVKLYKLGEERGLAYLSMEWVEGESLDELLARARRREPAAEGLTLPPRDRPELLRLLGLFEQIARAVQAAHAAGVLHRDLKPANVIIGPSGRPVLVDFGLGVDATDEATRVTRTGEVLGTLPYLAPEVLRAGLRAFDERSEVFALGVTLREALTLERPVASLGGPATPSRSARAALPRSKALRAVLEAATADDPDHRYGSAAELADDLGRLARGEPVSVLRAGPVERLVRAARRRPREAALLALSAALLAVVAWLGFDLESIARERLERVRGERAASDARVLLAEERAELTARVPAAVPALDRWLAETEALSGSTPLPADLSAELALAAERVGARRADAVTLRQRSIEAHAAEWSAAGERVARNPSYQGLALAPQLGLVPLGPDPASGLEEFAHLQTGTVPARDRASGRLLLEEESALVLVLVPGGAFLMGCERPGNSKSPDVRNIDPWTGDHERSIREVRVDPYFLGKHETTQGVWLRLTGENPSRWGPGSDAHVEVSLLHPVETVSWEMCTRALARVGLRLPTEAEWERGARGGTHTPWWTGEYKESLLGAVNCADAAVRRAGLDWNAADHWPELDDGFVEHAPVGTYRANPFGLHEVCGNVWELCEDRWTGWSLPWNMVDGVRVGSPPDDRRMYRGGGCTESYRLTGSARRRVSPPTDRFFSLGVRAARSLERP